MAAGSVDGLRVAGVSVAHDARGLGATGLTFFDDEVTDFFSPHARDKSVMFLVALGVPKKWR